MRWHDFGLRIVKNAAGEIGFEVYPGGGMGRTPFIAYKSRDFLDMHGIGLIVVGPKRLPELSRHIGRGLREFRKLRQEIDAERPSG